MMLSMIEAPKAPDGVFAQIRFLTPHSTITMKTRKRIYSRTGLGPPPKPNSVIASTGRHRANQNKAEGNAV